MSEPLTTIVELWPVASDDAGLWLVSGGEALRTTLPVPADSSAYGEAYSLLHRVEGRVRYFHSTSWRQQGPRLILSYIAVLDPDQPGVLAREQWPSALPISPTLLEAVGHPERHEATADAPIRRDVDVLLHSVRHIAFLATTDAAAAEALGTPSLRQQLATFSAALATMYLPDPDASAQAGAATRRQVE